MYTDMIIYIHTHIPAKPKCMEKNAMYHFGLNKNAMEKNAIKHKKMR